MVNRENLYRFLGRLYLEEIDATTLERLKVMRFPADGDDAAYSAGYKLLKEYLDTCGQSALTELAADYAKVFLGAGSAQGPAAFPYESVYTSHQRIMMQDPRDQVMAIFAAKGLRKEDNVISEDHIALLLSFMAFLCNESQSVSDTHDSAGVIECLKAQKDFLEQHLLNWVPAFCADIENLADTAFYKGVGKITDGYLRLDGAILDSLIDCSFMA